MDVIQWNLYRRVVATTSDGTEVVLKDQTPPRDEGRATSHVTFSTMVTPERTLSVRSMTNDGGEITIPYLSWGREADRGDGLPTSLILDGRLMYDIPDDLTREQIEDIAEFVANAIAIGAGYPSIYYTKRKMPFRG